MPLLILSVIVQIALVVHVMRTGRAVYWIYLIVFVPMIGSIAYLIVELLPELSGNPQARGALRSIRKKLDPEADIRQHQRMHKLSGSVDAARHLAGELTASGRYEEAIRHYEAALTGLYEHDPDLMLGLAQARFGNGDFAKARETLDVLIEKNPDFRSAEGHLLYARSVEQCGDLHKAEEEYRAVAAYYPGAEAKVRFAQLLERQGKPAEALAEYEDIVTSAELAPRHYRKAQKTWIAEASSGAKRLS
ncbi:MAG: tetratricopeptide repeat protein [Gammaproteobacteria bacterium]|nr:tetratricopeptide repeat protein [Gammaproteobacteria bacterium]MDH4313741.1 tetratricopeptide repeat protein [Gammaproteobacteria bacterium]MDH5213461.1 tetratricopeptide repeat protein [Gammaproteobacteria bacterium]